MVESAPDVAGPSPALEHREKARLEALHTERYSGDASLPEPKGEFGCDRLGIRLDGHLARTWKRAEQALEFPRLRERRRAAAEKDSLERRGKRDPFEIELCERGIDVGGVTVVPAHERDEVAVTAPMRTERQVNVEMSHARLGAHRLSPSRLRTARKASCGTSTEPSCFIRFFPFFWRSSSLRFRVTSPP